MKLWGKHSRQTGFFLVLNTYVHTHTFPIAVIKMEENHILSKLKETQIHLHVRCWVHALHNSHQNVSLNGKAHPHLFLMNVICYFSLYKTFPKQNNQGSAQWRTTASSRLQRGITSPACSCSCDETETDRLPVRTHSVTRAGPTRSAGNQLPLG